MTNRTALIVGANGLVGSSLLFKLLNDTSYTSVRTLVRRSMNLKHPKLQEKIVDFNTLSLADVAADDVFCCLGTTIRKAGSQEAFRKVDFHYPFTVARLAHQAGAKQFLLVTALGANKTSSVFYNRVKGDVEEAIIQVGFDSLHIFRPSILLGDRREVRPGEGIGKALAWVLGPIMIGPLKKYKGIHANKVAAAMIHFAKQNQEGIHTHESDALQEF